MTQTYAGPLVVSLLYILIYYGSMVRILFTKKRLLAEYRDRGEKFDRYFTEDREMLAADRAQLNMLEHMPPFLILLWLNAVFVSVSWATAVGAVYVLTRAVYPFIMGGKVGRGVRKSIYLVTFPGYAAIALYAIALFWSLATSGP